MRKRKRRRRKRRRRKRRRSPFQRRLEDLGYKTYGQYLKSVHWSNVKKRYANSKKPQACRCCGDPKYQLHHSTYERLGGERLSDFVPLCDTCHKKFHGYLKAHKELKLSDTKIILEAIKCQRS